MILSRFPFLLLVLVLFLRCSCFGVLAAGFCRCRWRPLDTLVVLEWSSCFGFSSFRKQAFPLGVGLARFAIRSRPALAPSHVSHNPRLGPYGIVLIFTIFQVDAFFAGLSFEGVKLCHSPAAFWDTALFLVGRGFSGITRNRHRSSCSPVRLVRSWGEALVHLRNSRVSIASPSA